MSIFACPLTEWRNSCIGDDEWRFEIKKLTPFVISLRQFVGERTWIGNVVIEFTVEHLENEFVVAMATTKFAKRNAGFVQHAHY